MNIHSYQDVDPMTPLQNKRQAILDATLELLVEHDLQSTSMSRIAQQAKVGMGTIYNYFESKEVLVSALFHQINSAMLEEMFRHYPEGGSVQERFFHIWRVKCTYFTAQPRAFLFVERFVDSPYIKPEPDEASLAALSKLDVMFAEAKQQGLVKDLPKTFFIPLVNGALGALIRSHVKGSIVLHEEAIEVAIAACWDAVKA